MLLKSNIVADHLPKNVDLSTVAKLMNSDVAKVIIPLLKDPKSFDSDDAKMLLNSKPMQMFRLQPDELHVTSWLDLCR